MTPGPFQAEGRRENSFKKRRERGEGKELVAPLPGGYLKTTA